MASPSAEECQSAFEQSVDITLHLWPALSFAVQHQWGGPDSEDKRVWFAKTIASFFPDIPTWRTRKTRNPDKVPDDEYIEAILHQVTEDEFDVVVDDGSAPNVAGHIVRLWAQCYAGNLAEVGELKTKWQSRRGNGAGAVFKQGEAPNQDTDDDSASSGDEDDTNDNHINGDMDMDEAPPLANAKRDNPSPEIDEDGFTKVSRRKR